MGSISHPSISPLKVNASRIMQSLHETCEYGAAHPYGKLITETGMARLSLDDSDQRVRNWFMAKAQSLRCHTFIDEMGNLFAIRPGKNKTAPPIMIGSHLDTQPTGGRYDGILGVMAGLEALQTLEENKVETNGPVGIVNWTNEEGARFPIMAVGSAVWAGAMPLETAWAQKEVTACKGSPQSMKDELNRIGYLGKQAASWQANPFAAHFELHIEQGPVLEDKGLNIGVVHGAQAFKWFEISVKGTDSHAGTTPFYARRDAVLSATKMVCAANTIAERYGGLTTTGRFVADPGTVNTIARMATFTLDIRHRKDAVLEEMVQQCKDEFTRIAQEKCKMGCEVEWKPLVASPAVEFDSECIVAVEESAEDVLSAGSPGSKLWQAMVSGAGHDSCNTNLRCPTSMIFTPTRGGISHNPAEYCSPDDCAIGANVLLGAVLRYDSLRSQRGDFE